MPNPVQRTPYITFQETDTIAAPEWVDNLASPVNQGQLANADVNSLSPAELGTLIQKSAERQGIVIVKGALVPN